MNWFACRTCVAKDAEIQRLTSLLQASIDRAERQQADILRMARDAAGLGLPAPTPETPSPTPLLDASVELFLDAKFVRGTPLWKQQYREAVKLAAEQATPEKIIKTLGDGQAVEF